MSEKSRRTDFIKQSGAGGSIAWTGLLLFLIKIIYMTYQTGMGGMTYYAYADAVFITVYILLAAAVLPIHKKMLCFQFNHGNYKNAMKVYRVISGYTTVLGVIIAIVFFVLARQMGTLLFGTRLCALLFMFISVAIVTWIMMFNLRGYMEGIGNAMPGMFAELIAHATSLVITLLTQPFFSGYGRKVAALMRQDTYAYAYSVCSGALGLALGGLAGVLFLMLIRTFFGKEIRRRIRLDEARKTDSAQDILWNFSTNYVKTAFLEYIGVFLAVVLLVMFGHGHAEKGNTAGMIYLCMGIIILPFVLLTRQMCQPFGRQLGSIMKHADFHHAKERLSFYLKLLTHMMLPCFATCFAIAPVLAQLCFDSENQEVASMIRTGMICGICVTYGMFFRQSLMCVVKPYIRNICAGIFILSGIVFWFVLGWSNVSAQECTSNAYILASLVYALLAAFFVLKKIRIYNRLIDSFVVPAVGALLGGAVAFGLFVILDGKLPEIVLLFICAACSYICYHLLITFLGIFEKHEWNEVPCSGLAELIAKLIGKY